MTSCTICQAEHKDGQQYCDLCTSILRTSGHHRWLDLVPSPLVVESRNMLHGLTSSRARWAHLKQAPWVSEAGNWARLEDPRMDPIGIWHAGKAAFEEAAKAARSLDGLKPEHHRVLAQGVTLTTGQLVQFSDEGVLIDGRGPFARVPWKDLLELMGSPSRRGWDLLGLAMAAASVSGAGILVPMQPVEFGAHRVNRHRVIQETHPGQPLICWLSTLKRLKAPLDDVTSLWVTGFEQSPPLRWQGRGARGLQREALNELIRQRPQRLADGRTEPWVAAWNTTEEVVHRPLPQALSSDQGRLSLRVARLARGGDVLSIKVPRDPRLWAWLLAWMLAPPWSEERARLHAFAVAWNGEQRNDVSPALARSIVLLRDVLHQSNARTHVEGNRLLVRGRFGHGYEMQVRPGAHMAPFVVRGVDGQGHTVEPPLCITEDRTSPSLPLGDVLASVVLSLLDDVGTAATIEPLHRFMSIMSPAFESDDEPVDDQSLREALPWFQPAETKGRRAFDPRWYCGTNARKGTVLNQHKYVQAWIEATSDGRQRHQRRHTWMNPPHGGNNRVAGRFQRRMREHMEGRGVGERVEHNMIELLNQGLQEANPMEGFAALRGRVHIRDGVGQREQRPDIRDAPLRIRNLYARVWTILGRSAFGREVRLAAGTPYDVELPTGLQFTVRNHREHQFLRRLLRLAGWGEGDDPLHFVRRRRWPRGAQARLARELNRWQHRIGAQGDAPWWWNYPREEFIDEGMLNDWRLREDLRD